MEFHCNSVGRFFSFQQEGMEELRHYHLYTAELETEVVVGKEEIAKRDLDIINLKDLLARTVKERNDSQAQCQKLMFEKFFLQQQLQLQQHENQNLQKQEIHLLHQESAPVSGNCSSEDESKACDINNQSNTPDSSKLRALPQREQVVSGLRHSQEFPIVDIVTQLATDLQLPEKGKLLQAVKDTGPLLKTLLLAGPLPQWQHPPPHLDCIDIPPVNISSPGGQLVQQDSLTSSSSTFSKKRAMESTDATDISSISSPTSKYRKLSLS